MKYRNKHWKEEGLLRPSIAMINLNRSIKGIAKEIVSSEKYYSKLSNQEISEKFMNMRKFLDGTKNKEKVIEYEIDEIYSMVREMVRRYYGLNINTSQIKGAIRLHQGNIIQMLTGEGKTITCVFPAILNALLGKVHIITANEYLAKRDSQNLRTIYEFFGFTCGCVTNEMLDIEKMQQYDCDIVYSTSTNIGFDYLRDNLKRDKREKLIKSFDYAIVDEADFVLLDEAKTPLIISGNRQYDTSIYKIVSTYVKSLKRGKNKTIKIEGDELFKKQAENSLSEEEEDILGDFTIDITNKNVVLTERGIRKIESFFAIKFEERHDFIHFVQNALRAEYLLKNNVDYIVKDNEIQLIDRNSGRVMDGRQYSNGLHQAIEAKENIKITGENKTVASITIQSLFCMYSKLSGMTGTLGSNSKELKDVYNVSVNIIKPNVEPIRKDHEEVIFFTKKEKYDHLIEVIKKRIPQPILIGTNNIEDSEIVSNLLNKNGIKHELLNAKNHEKEAHIIAQAGRVGSVTVATDMAGRGVDIVLGGNATELALIEYKKMYHSMDYEIIQIQNKFCDEEYKEKRKIFLELKEKYERQLADEREKVINLGGLLVISTERHDSKRIDDQLRGRSGRQGDVGESMQFISLEDKMIKEVLSKTKIESIKSNLVPGQPASAYSKRMIRHAQMQLEAQGIEQRRELLEYDRITNKYRIKYYEYRDKVLGMSLNELKKTLQDRIVDEEFSTLYDGYVDMLRSYGRDPKSLMKDLYLRMLDDSYADLLLALEQLKEFSTISNYGSVKPVDKYNIIAKEYFNKMLSVSYELIYDYIKRRKTTRVKITL